MPRLALIACFLIFFGFLGSLLFVTGLHNDVLDRTQNSCDPGQHTKTRHRSGKQPRSLVQGLQRRACGFTARITGRRAPQEFGYVLISAERLQLPGIVDSNSPAFWDGNALRLFNSAWEESYLSTGNAIDNLGDPERIELPQLERPGSVWLESVWHDPDTSLLYGWYHFEPDDLVCQTAPIIGAAISRPEAYLGRSRHDYRHPIWRELRLRQWLFAGGNGDFSVLLRPNRRYFYLFTLPHGPMDQQRYRRRQEPGADKGQPALLSQIPRR
jgi:hypothetical protein